MEKLLIKGGNVLDGEISCSGAKNAALFAVSILAVSNKALSKKLDIWRKEQSKNVALKPS